VRASEGDGIGIPMAMVALGTAKARLLERDLSLVPAEEPGVRAPDFGDNGAPSAMAYWRIWND